MDEMREVFDDHAHGLRGPHQEVPASFAPLRLRTEPEQTPILVNQPEVIVGRHSGADVRLAFPEISRRHCRLVFAEGHWRVHDLNSLNGVYVNEERMIESPLYEGDRLRVGPVVLVVENAAPEHVRRALQQIADHIPPAA